MTTGTKMSERQRPDWDQTWMKVAKTVGKRSLCTRDQVGAVIASETNRVVAVGYNNPPAGFDHQGMNCLAWCPRAKDLVTFNGYQHDGSMTSSHQLTEWTHSIDGTITLEVDGFTHYTVDGDTSNGAVREIMESCGYKPVYGKGDKPCGSLHAEANALSVCDRSQREGGTLYVTSAPCYECAKLVANSGLKRVVFRVTDRGEERLGREKVNPLDYLLDCGVRVTAV